MTERAVASTQGLVLADGTPWPEDAIEVARVIDAWGVKGGIKLHPFSSDPQALFCTKKWFVQPAVPQAGAVRKPTAPAGAATGAATAIPARKNTASTASADNRAPVRLSQPALLRVKSAKEQGDVIVATIDGLDDRNGAEALKGARVFVSRSAFPTPDSDDEFYWIDLIGLNVVNREGQSLGTVVDLLDTGPHCVLRCSLPPTETAKPGDAAERLIPFVSAYIDRVSLAERLIVADWGLDY
ncbi:MAG TPA: ribosome maturation factor RimM [Candidatus Aquabacterium excrementipullorum]|nr:ribosome maturation factor RimM [Candidatus Aquabacterium excrementipullorum]